MNIILYDKFRKDSTHFPPVGQHLGAELIVIEHVKHIPLSQEELHPLYVSQLNQVVRVLLVDNKKMHYNIFLKGFDNHF